MLHIGLVSRKHIFLSLPTVSLWGCRHSFFNFTVARTSHEVLLHLLPLHRVVKATVDHVLAHNSQFDTLVHEIMACLDPEQRVYHL